VAENVTPTTQSLEQLAEKFDTPPTRNPWPEDSDYGKLWRKGYRCGQRDEARASIVRHLRARTQQEVPNDGR
jgi:hypothetical protein